jgi:hypothetical protein
MYLFRKRGCMASERLQKATLLAMLPSDTGVGRYIHSLDLSNWEIASFSPYSKEVCVSLINEKGNKTISLIVPQLTNDGIKNNVPFG